MQTRKFLISGRVQGVGFRYATVDEARQLGITGYVRNLWDGRVEVVAQGPEESLVKMERWLHQGPSTAKVTSLERMQLQERMTFTDFRIRFGSR